MRGRIIAITMLGTICGSLLQVAPQSARADVNIGGDTEALLLYDLEEFAEFAGPSGSAFVLLTNEELGISFGERLVGQVNMPVSDFDFVTGTPTAPLAIDVSGDASVGVNVLTFYSTIIDGIGRLGFPDPLAIGDGALTVLFDRDQSVIGFDVVGTNGGMLDIQFFDRRGNLLDHLELHDVSDTSYVFTSDHEDIAAITVNNLDHGGVGYDNFRFVPGTGTVATPLTCSLTGPLVAGREGDVTTVTLEADVTSGSDPDSLMMLWTADCPEGSFDSVTSTLALLNIDTSVSCQMQCDVTLTVDDGLETATCTTTVTVEALESPPSIEVDATAIVVEDVDCAGDVLVELPNASATDAAGLPVDVSNDAPETFPAGQTTTVTYLATDLCGQTAEVAIDVTVSSGAGVAVEVLSSDPDRPRRGGGHVEPLADVAVAAYDSSNASCVRQQMRAVSGISRHTLESIVASCSPVGATQTDTDGMAFLDLAPGEYVVIAAIDLDLDGLPDAFSGRPVGRLNCGQWKSRRLFLRQDTD